MCLIVLLLSVPARAASVSLAWDAPPQPVLSYRVLWGTDAGGLDHVHEAGPGTQTTVPNLTLGVRYFFVVVGVGPDGVITPPSNLVDTIPTDAACDFPLGNKAVSVFVTALQKTGSGGAGSKARLDFQVASPNSPISRVAVRTNGNDLAVMTGNDLGALAGMWFQVGNIPGTYTLAAAATNAYGCSREVVSTQRIVVK